MIQQVQIVLADITNFLTLNANVTRDKKFEYGLVLDWNETVHIGIASGLLSLSETRNEVSRYGSSMASKTGQLTAISNDPAAVQSIKGDSSILQKKQSIKGD